MHVNESKMQLSNMRAICLGHDIMPKHVDLQLYIREQSLKVPQMQSKIDIRRMSRVFSTCCGVCPNLYEQNAPFRKTM